jgi:hypothetical protein
MKEYLIFNTKKHDFLKFDNGQVIIYGDLEECQKDLRDDDVITDVNIN